MTNNNIAPAANEVKKVRPAAILMLALASLVYMLAALERISPPVVALDIMDSLRIGPDDMGLIFSATFLTYALMQPLAGHCADRFAPKRCLAMCAALLALSSIWFSQSQSFFSAWLSRALVGLAAGLAFVPAVRLSANWLPEKHFGMASTCILAASAFSNFLAGSPLARTAGQHGWRFSFLALGLIALVVLALVLLVISDRPKTEGRPKENGKSEAEEKQSLIKTAKLVLRAPVFWLISLVYSGTDLVYDVFTGLWAGPFLKEVHGLSSVAAGNMLSTAAVGFLVGGPLLVMLGNRWGSYSKVVICMCLMNVGITAFIIWGPKEAAPWMLQLLCLAAPLGIHCTGLLFAIGKSFFPEKVTGAVIGFLNLMPFLVGAVMQSVVGRILAFVRTSPDSSSLGAHFHYAQAFKPILFWCVLSTLAAFWLKKKAAVTFFK
ncbi:MAG: MFS transporter [Deltaproteobacteria bacterium]|jgi:sugar phosphate permease|nr:MFS transporter [Deltaproteobacteria bacterium]